MDSARATLSSRARSKSSRANSAWYSSSEPWRRARPSPGAYASFTGARWAAAYRRLIKSLRSFRSKLSQGRRRVALRLRCAFKVVATDSVDAARTGELAGGFVCSARRLSADGTGWGGSAPSSRSACGHLESAPVTKSAASSKWLEAFITTDVAVADSTASPIPPTCAQKKTKNIL